MSRVLDSDRIDVSVPIRPGMVHWPGDPPVTIKRTQEIERVDSANVSKISMGVYTGTHMDAPIHFLDGGRGIDTPPLSATIGRAGVVRIDDQKSVTPDELAAHKIRRGERILLKTRNSTRCRHTDSTLHRIRRRSHGDT